MGLDPVAAHAASHNANEHNKLQHLETLKALGLVKEGEEVYEGDEPEKTEVQQQYERGRKLHIESELDCARRSRGRALSVDSHKRVVENAGAEYDYHHGAMQGAVYSFEYGLMAASYIPGPTGFAAGVVDAAYGYHTGRYDALDVAQTVISSSSGVLRTARPFLSAARGADKLGRVAGHGAPSAAAAAAPSRMPVCMTKSHNPKADVFKRVARDDSYIPQSQTGSGFLGFDARVARLERAGDAVSVRAKLFGTDHVHVFKGDRVRAIGGQKPDNYALAGTTYHFEGVKNVDLRNALRAKYPHGVPFTGSGLADFSRYALHKVQIDMTGKNWLDFSAANKAMRWKETPAGMTWHHHYDGKTMMLVPSDIHARPSMPHTGGAAIVKMIKEAK